MKDKNIELLFVKAIGILAVVSCHIGTNLFNIIGIPISKTVELFPEYSYHMPLFIFSSGYFYNIFNERKSLFLYFKNKSKLLKNYYKINLFYLILCFILISFGFYKRTIDFTLYNFLIEPFLGGFQWYFNGPGWFVPFLFCLQIIYLIIRKFINIKSSFKNELFITLSLILIGFIATYISKIYPVENDNVNFIHSVLRILFGLQFFQLGFLYKNHLENKLKFSYKSFILIILLKIIFSNIFGYYSFSLRTNKFYGSVFLPFIVSIFGIIYILHICRFIFKFTNENTNLSFIKNLLCYIGNNTWGIMMHHLLVKWSVSNLLKSMPLPVNLVNLISYFLIPISCIIISILIDKIITYLSFKFKSIFSQYFINVSKI